MVVELEPGNEEPLFFFSLCWCWYARNGEIIPGKRDEREREGKRNDNGQGIVRQLLLYKNAEGEREREQKSFG